MDNIFKKYLDNLKNITPKAITHREKIVVGEEKLEGNKTERLKFLLKKGADKGVIASCLSFDESKEKWALFEEILQLSEKEEKIKKEAIYNDLISGLAGSEEKKAWELRENSKNDLNNVCLSLRGLNSSRAWELRKKIFQELKGKNDYYKNSQNLKRNLFLSLIGLNSREAWEARKELLENGGSPRDYILSLSGVNSREAEEKINYYFSNAKFYSGQGLLNALMISSIGIDNRNNKIIRADFIKNKGDNDTLLDSLALNKTKEASELREKNLAKYNQTVNELEKKNLALHLGLSTVGVKDNLAEKIRNILLNDGYYNAVVYSLNGDLFSSYLANKEISK